MFTAMKGDRAVSVLTETCLTAVMAPFMIAAEVKL